MNPWFDKHKLRSLMLTSDAGRIWRMAAKSKTGSGPSAAYLALPVRRHDPLFSVRTEGAHPAGSSCRGVGRAALFVFSEFIFAAVETSGQQSHGGKRLKTRFRHLNLKIHNTHSAASLPAHFVFNVVIKFNCLLNTPHTAG